MNRRRFTLFLILLSAVVAFVLLHSRLRVGHPVGLKVPIGNAARPPDCATKFELRTPLVLHLLADRSFKLDDEAIEDSQGLKKTLNLIYRERLSREIYIEADPNLEYQFFVQTIASIRERFPDMRVYLVTPSSWRVFCLDTIPTGPVYD